MSDYDMNIHTNPDAKTWSEFFIKTLKENNWNIQDINEELMLGWFANAMMAMHDHLNNEKILGKDKRIAELEESLRTVAQTRCVSYEDLATRDLEQQAKGIEDAVNYLERPDVPMAPAFILNDDLRDYAENLREQAKQLKGGDV